MIPEPAHHIPDALLIAYQNGSLNLPYSVVLASHISMCDECRARYEAHLQFGGLLLEDAEATPVTEGLVASVLARLDLADSEPPPARPHGIYPAPLAEVLGGRDPRWQRIGMGIRQSILWSRPEGSLRLLWIPAGQAVSDHGHNGLEMTLVLQGSFGHDGRTFGLGDVEIADDDDVHTPVAGPGADCICLAATDAPLRFTGLIPRLLQPILRI